MKIPSSNPTPESARRGEGAKHPVLARLPDVTEPPSPLQSTARAAAAGFVDYRFDPPSGVGHDPAGDNRSAQPHVFQRAARIESRVRPHRSPSPILPDSSPFSFPSTSLHDRLTELGRFLMLFALFTAAGTAYFMSKQGSQSPSEPVTPRPGVSRAATASQQSLVPAANEVKPPTAIGPLGVVSQTPTQLSSTSADPQLAEESSPSPIDNTESEIPQTLTMPAPTLARANGTPLPQVRTTDLPKAAREQDSVGVPAVARLPGYILEVPSRQAHHDVNQSSVH